MAGTDDDPPGMSDVPVRLVTPRTVVRLAALEDAAEIVRFYTENQERFRSFDPERPPLFYEEGFWRMQIQRNLADFAADRSLRLFLFASSGPARVIGNISFTNFVRGVSQTCTLGYSLAGEAEGQGLMTEALGTAIGFVFRSLQFHRIEANYMPHNRRSGDLLRRLGFGVEGYSRDYLRINGKWEDHIRAALIAPGADG